MSAGVELEADFAHGRPTHGYAPGARAVVRAVGGGAPLGAAEARAALAAHGDAMQHVLDRMAGRAVGRGAQLRAAQGGRPARRLLRGRARARAAAARRALAAELPRAGRGGGAEGAEVEGALKNNPLLY